MKLNILGIAVHPDDIEIGCGGTVLKHIDMGYSVGIIDLTRGELGTRGTPELRMQEAQEAAKILGVHVRENLEMADGFFTHSKENILRIVPKIRKYQPDIVLTNTLEDRHPDHGRAAKLVAEACFLAGLVKIETRDENEQLQERWRPKAIYHFIQDYYLKPDVIVDISPYIEKKNGGIVCV